jgi:hypothetical protein
LEANQSCQKKQEQMKGSRMKMKSILLTLATALAGFSANAANNLIYNGSFESPTVNNVYSYITPTDWTGGTLLFNTVGDGFWPAPQDGNQYEDIGFTGYPALTQVVNVPKTGSYSLTWYDNEAVGYSHSYDVLINGNTVATGSGIGSLTWQSQSLLLNLSAGPNTLSFQGAAGSDTLIDNVSLTSVPEPPTIIAGAMLLLPFGLSTLRNLRRKS